MLCDVAACPIRNRPHYVTIFCKLCNHQQVLICTGALVNTLCKCSTEILKLECKFVLYESAGAIAPVMLYLWSCH